MSDLVWRSPPPEPESGRAVSKYRRMAKQLQERPGEWAIVASFTSHAGAGALKNRFRRGYYGESFESVVSYEDPHQWNVYARYVGEPEKPQDKTP